MIVLGVPGKNNGPFWPQATKNTTLKMNAKSLTGLLFIIKTPSLRQYAEVP